MILQTDWVKDVNAGNLWDALFGPTYAIVGEAGFALFATAVTATALFAWTRSLVAVGSWLAIISGVVLTALPPRAAFVGYVLLAVAMALGLYEIIK